MKKTISGIVLTLLLTSMLTTTFIIQPVKAEPGTIYIRADGSVDPPTAPILNIGNVYYTFTADVYDSIVVQRSNIVVNGAGYNVQGTGSGIGILLSNVGNVIVKNVIIKNFYEGIKLSYSSNNRIIENSLSKNVLRGIYLRYSSNNIIAENTVQDSQQEGIIVIFSLNNEIIENNISGTNAGIYLGQKGVNAECSNHNVTGNRLSSNFNGIWSMADNTTITKNTVKNGGFGITLSGNVHNTVAENEIFGFQRGILLSQASKNNITGNLVSGEPGWYGIWLQSSSTNNIAQNNVSGFLYGGIRLEKLIVPPPYVTEPSMDNKIYHNNFVNNIPNVFSSDSINIWDDGYPSGGNYWSDYTGVDSNGDGMGDTPYVIDANNRDRYPLMNSWTTMPSTPPTFSVGDRVRTTANLNVREGPGLGYGIIGTMAEGALGQILGGPVEADGYIWWDVNYDVGIRGWSAENWLEPVDEPPVPPVPLRPINLSPPDGAANVSRQPQLLSSPPLSGLETEQIPWEEIQDGVYVTRVDSQWQVTTVPGDYSDPVFDDTLTDGLVSRNEWQRPDAWSHWVFAALDYETTYYWRVRHKDFRGTWSLWSEETSFTTYQLNPPEADFNYSPENPKAGEIVDIDASDSHPGGGWEISSYRWDLDGDGDFDGLTTSPVIYYSWEKSGAYNVTLEVVNQYGDRATCSREIIVEQNPLWERTIEAMKRRIFGSEGPTEEDKTRFEIIKKELRLEEFDEFYDSTVPTWVRDMQILMALNENTATEEGKITYGQYLLQVLHDMALVDSYVSYNWVGRPEVNLYFQEMAEISSWVQWVLIVGPKFFPQGTGSILMLPKVFQAGVSLKFIYETLYDRAVWLYMNDPDPNAEPILFFPRGITPEQQEHLRKLREEYAFPLQTRREEFKEEVREKLRAFLHQVLEKYKLLPVHAYYVKSPVELRVYDSQGNVTGLVDGEVREEIMGSVYVNGTVMIYPAIDFYHLVVTGIDEGNYGLELTSVTLGQVLNFTATDIPASSNTIHRYTIDWDALSLGEEGVTVQVDSDGDGVFEHTFTSDSEFTLSEYVIGTDGTPPETWLNVDEPKFVVNDITYLTSATPIELIAEDNPGGSDVASTAYRLYNVTYDSGWITYTQPFYLIGLSDGAYQIDYNSTDYAGNVELSNTVTVILDNTGPSVTIENPPPGWALQDGVTFIVLANDASGTHSLNFSIREANGDQGIPVGFENIPATYDAATGRWNWSFNTLQLPDGFYIILVSAKDNLGHTASITVQYSIRNWAVIELLPASENSKAGRTMPVKFSLRVAALVDPDQPFVYNEELTIKIYATDSPSNILQTSAFGDTARDFRISTVSQHYITNFQTLKTPKTYVVEIWRENMLIDWFEFTTTAGRGGTCWALMV